MKLHENNRWDTNVTFSSSKPLQYLSQPKCYHDPHFAKHRLKVVANMRAIRKVISGELLKNQALQNCSLHT
jgi:hypothetical protein